MSEELFVAVCHRRADGGPRHWMIVLHPPGSRNCTWFHVVLDEMGEYHLQIQAGKRFDSFGIEYKQYVQIIDQKNLRKVQAAAQAVPMQRCQLWTVEVLGKLERKGLVPEGTAHYFASQVEERVDPSRQTSNSRSHGARRVVSATPSDVLPDRRRRSPGGGGNGRGGVNIVTLAPSDTYQEDRRAPSSRHGTSHAGRPNILTVAPSDDRRYGSRYDGSGDQMRHIRR